MHLLDTNFLNCSQQSMDGSEFGSVQDLHFDSSDNLSQCHSQTNKPKRKREKLDHLSFEEKMNRRKMKNRISAQSARDRKKLKMNDLETKIQILNEEKMKILREFELLKRRNEQLMKENISLKSRLSGSEGDSFDRTLSDCENSADESPFSPMDSLHKQEERLDELIEPVLGPNGHQKLVDLAAVTSIETAELINVSLQKNQEEQKVNLTNLPVRPSPMRNQRPSNAILSCPLWIRQLICLFILAVKSATMSFDGSKTVTNNCLTPMLMSLCSQLSTHQLRQLFRVLSNPTSLQPLVQYLLQQPDLQAMIRKPPQMASLQRLMRMNSMLSQTALHQLNLDTFD